MMSSGFVDWGCGGIARSPVEVVLQRIERAVPVAGQRGQELLRYLHRGGPQPVPHPAPFSRFGPHQAGLGQQCQVLGNRLPGDRQPPPGRWPWPGPARPARLGWPAGSGRPAR